MRSTAAALVLSAITIACDGTSTVAIAPDATPTDATVSDSATTGDDAGLADMGEAPLDTATDDTATDDAATDDTASEDAATEDTADTTGESPDVFGDPGTESLPPAPVRGTVRIFGPPGGPLPGATITVLEHPGMSAVTDEDGRFEIEDVPAGYVTLVMTAAGYPENQLGTQRHAGTALDDCDFQAVSEGIYDLFALLTESEPSAELCQISTTVTRYFEGSLPTVHGEPGATAELTPDSAGHPGPIYFNDDVLPTPGLTETSVDGGVVWTNVLPGEYVLTAEKEGVTFEPVKIRCRPGVLVNAGPPRGLQGQQPGGPY